MEVVERETTSSNGQAEGEEDEERERSGGELAWGTLEELLLACAVNRHGTHSWDSIAKELESRFHNKSSFSPSTCRLKYVDLKRRFKDGEERECDGGDDGDGELSKMVDELRKIRVDELKKEVHRRDVSIVSLQRKVKRLEEERESTDLKAEINDKPLRTGEKGEEPVGEARTGGDSGENRSFNESNEEEKVKPEEGGEPNRTSRLSELGGGEKGGGGDSNIINNNNNKGLQQQQGSDVQSSASLSKKKRRRFRGGATSSGDEVEAEEVSPASNKRISVKSQPLVKFLDIVRSHKHGSVFHRRLPSQETEKYRNVIRQHMDLDTVQSRLDKGVYCDCHPKFYRDLLLVFTNAVLFYRKSSAEHLAAKELRKIVLDETALRTPKPIKDHHLKTDLEPQHIEPVVKKPRSLTTMVVCRRRSSMQALSDGLKKKEDASSNGNSEENKKESSSKVENVRMEKPKLDHQPKKVDDGKKEKDIEKVGVDAKKLISREKSLMGRGSLRLGNNNGKKMISKEREKIVKSIVDKEETSDGDGAENVEIRKKMNADQKQEKGASTLKKQGVANFLKRIKQNSPSSQEKLKNNESEDEDEEDEHEEEARRPKTDSVSNVKKKSANTKRNTRDESVATRRNPGRRGERETATSRRGIGRPPKRKAAMISTPESGKGGRSGSRDGGDKSKKKPRR